MRVEPRSLATSYSMSATFDEISGRLIPPLVPPAAFAAVQCVAARLPAALSDRFFFECRLAADDPRVDLIAGVNRQRTTLLDESSPTGLMRPLRAHAEWQRIAALAREWRRPASVLSRALDQIWVEFDVPSLVPSLFLSFTPASGDLAFEAIAAGVRLVAGGRTTAVQIHRLRTCVERLPPGAVVKYLGLMLPRPSPAVRVCLSRVSGDGLDRCLRDVGWTGSLPAIADLMRHMADVPSGAAVPRIGLVHLDVADRVLPQLGIEYVFEPRRQLDGGLEERAILDRLVALGLCSSAKRDALVDWPGHSIAELSHEMWPSILVRRLHCVKVVHGDGGTASVKAYLGLNTIPRRRGKGVSHVSRAAQAADGAAA